MCFISMLTDKWKTMVVDILESHKLPISKVELPILYYVYTYYE